MFTLLIVIIILALVFDYINGFHDAANSIATIVSTKVLTPFKAVVWAAFFNLIAFLIFKLHIVNTIAKTVDTSSITLQVILAGLIALTLISVAVTKIYLGTLTVFIALFIAAVKSTFVLRVFMHLKFENRMFTVMVIAVMLLIGVVIFITLLDYLYR